MASTQQKKDSKYMRALDPFNIFGFDQSAEGELEDKLSASRARQDELMQQLQDYIQQTNAQNQQLWSDYGAGLSDYEQQLADVLSSQRGAYSTLADSLRGYKNVEDIFKDAPQLAAHDADSRQRELANLSKIGALTDIKETAEERFMREVARREMENQLQAQRGATAQNLKARGVYGGGAELASALGAQQEAAQRRSLEDLGAQANAQRRALSALGQYQQGAASMSAADDALSKFNSSLLQQNKALQGNARATDNTAQQQRGTTLFNAGTTVNQMAGNKADKVRGDQQAVVAGKAGTNTQALGNMQNLIGMQYQNEGSKQAQAIAEQPTGGFLSGLLNLGW